MRRNITWAIVMILVCFGACAGSIEVQSSISSTSKTLQCFDINIESGQKSSTTAPTDCQITDQVLDTSPVELIRLASVPKTQSSSNAEARKPQNKGQRGIASWYGKSFDGKKAANRKPFKSDKISVAHKTIKLGSFLHVTNLSNGRSIIVEVTDRGPYEKNRDLDLSHAAWKQLGGKDEGIMRVAFKVLKH